MRDRVAVVVVVGLAGCRVSVPQPDSEVVDDSDTGTLVPQPSPAAWVQVTPYPCARSAEGQVRCWASATSTEHGLAFPIPSPDFLATDVWAPGVGSPAAIRVNDDRAKVWFCTFTELSPIPVATPAVCSPPDGYAFRRVGWASGLTTDGQLIRWDQGYPEPVTGCPLDREYRLFEAPDRLYAMADDQTTCVELPRRPPVYEQTYALDAFPSTLEVVKIAPGGEGICGLGADGTIVCLGAELAGTFDAPVMFSDPPYVDLAGGGFAVCAVRSDWTVVCNDGSEHHFGPIRTLAVHSHSTYDQVTGEFQGGPSPRSGFGLCVVTEANAIRCVGNRYLPDLQALLP